MEKILVQRLVDPADRSDTPSLIGSAIASMVRASKGACDYVFIRVDSPEHIDIEFLSGIDTYAVVVDLEVEAPASVQAEFDYVVTIHAGDPAAEQYVPCSACGTHYGRAPHGQFRRCACGQCEPSTATPLRSLFQRFMKCRPLGRPASV